jgi:antitoxin (DNA-binding transcriptional repressor) of toxin-antitoxin stability system
MTRDVQRVAFTAFRNDLASYLEKLAKGEELQIMNARRGKLIVSLVASGGKWAKKSL